MGRGEGRDPSLELRLHLRAARGRSLQSAGGRSPPVCQCTRPRPRHTRRPIQAGAGDCAQPRGEVRRGTAEERTVPVTKTRSRLPSAVYIRLPSPHSSSGRSARARQGRGAVRTAHLIWQGQPQVARLERPGASTTVNKRSPGGDPGDPLRHRVAAVHRTARAAESCGPRRRPHRRCTSVSVTSTQVPLP
ncbi:hypothetical protein NDU88_005783 [Pleurodeles waltl]|uniref:Uncharacterized protein n=1 Tax=Pleurodeles waltl TaxID=8319 RepID=A0AAV7PGP4_PLEWA|nr:hypothetical protein NDU88_005783 [Pleurodeles waltl]